ncbi:hypothetical protein D3C80_944680 [compost metagenome]
MRTSFATSLSPSCASVAMDITVASGTSGNLDRRRAVQSVRPTVRGFSMRSRNGLRSARRAAFSKVAGISGNASTWMQPSSTGHSLRRYQTKDSPSTFLCARVIRSISRPAIMTRTVNSISNCLKQESLRCGGVVPIMPTIAFRVQRFALVSDQRQPLEGGHGRSEMSFGIKCLSSAPSLLSSVGLSVPRTIRCLWGRGGEVWGLR